jgi:hypothetical protein
MSSPSHKADSSLNNLPENNTAKTTSNLFDTNQTNDKLIPTGNDKTNVEQNTPIDKHGDSWGGGIPGHKQTNILIYLIYTESTFFLLFKLGLFILKHHSLLINFL